MFQLIDQRGYLALGDFGPALFVADRSSFDQPLPQTQRQTQGRTTPNHAPGLIRFDCLQVLAQRVFTLIGQPVDEQLRPIRLIVQNPRAPRRQFEDRRTAQTPMRDQQRAGLRERFAFDLDPRIGHGNTGQSCQARISDCEREQRGDRRLDRVAERRRPRIALPIAPSCQQDPIGCSRRARVQSHHETHSSIALDRGDGDLRADRHPGAVRRVQQAIDNRCRSIGDGEDTAVGFGLEGHAALREPGDRVARLKPRKGAAQRRTAARIVLHQQRRIETGVRGVAAAAAGDAHLAQQRAALLQQCDARVWISFRAGDGGKQARRSTADDQDLKIGRHAGIIPGAQTTSFRGLSADPCGALRQ
ncbi:MAG: hypothetical protein A2W31_01915 [Planctomycetes bacterium RBG_16_64_10]|nr:MAG: hypothetical protein A2W31_01915 [Planctomycetes bacterium RBG_16_64_10]